jgi:hypothetical protein
MLVSEKNESPVKSTTRRVHALATAQAEAEGVMPESRRRRISHPMPSALGHAREQARARRGAPAVGERPATPPPRSVHDDETASLFGRAQLAIEKARSLAEDHAFIVWWTRMRPSSGVRRTPLLMEEEQHR